MWRHVRLFHSALYFLVTLVLDTVSSWYYLDLPRSGRWSTIWTDCYLEASKTFVIFQGGLHHSS